MRCEIDLGVYSRYKGLVSDRWMCYDMACIWQIYLCECIWACKPVRTDSLISCIWHITGLYLRGRSIWAKLYLAFNWRALSVVQIELRRAHSSS
jgi:hypothetical protein